MRKILFIIVILLTTTSCAGTNDWSFSLPNDYEVWRINSYEIKLVRLSDNFVTEIIPSFIKEFAYDDQYVFTRNIDNICENNILNEKFYVLDTENNVLHGPYNEMEDFINNLGNLQIKVPTHWYRTSPDPNTQNINTN